MNPLNFQLTKPSKEEYNPYFESYIKLVQIKTSYSDAFNDNTSEVIKDFSNIAIDKHDYKYAKDKWSIKEVLKHIIDTERIFSYRLLVILRNDKSTNIQSYDDKFYADNADVTHISMESLLEEFKTVRKSMALIFQHSNETQINLTGKIGAHTITPSAIAYIMLGHAKHHLNILKERY